MRVATFILLFIICHIISEANAGCSDSHTDELNFYAITAILDRMVRTNDTLLHHIAGIFSNLNDPVKEVLVTYKLLIPRDEDNCTLDNCDHSQHAYSLESSDSCPSGYYCITTDTFIWAQRRVTAHNVVLRHIDTCPFVIGKFARQKEITIYFDFKNPPSCNSSVLDERIIEREELPCGWICKPIRASNFQGVLHPRSTDVFYSNRINDESHIDKALKRITSKLRQYAIVKQGNLPGFSYELELYLGYATKYHSSRYFDQSSTYAEYGIFIAAYACMHVMLIIVTYDCGSSIYKSIDNIRDATSGDKDKRKLQQQHIFLYSFIFTSFIKSGNLILASLVEGGGVCLTQMHIYLIGIALISGILNLPLFICLFRNKCCTCDSFLQIIVCFYIIFNLHILLLLSLLTAVSFIYNPSGTTVLIVYFCLSVVVLWVVNAIVMYLIKENWGIIRRRLDLPAGSTTTPPPASTTTPPPAGTTTPGTMTPPPAVTSHRDRRFAAFMRILFAIILFFSFNLINLSIMPFIGDYYYDRRASIQTVISIMVPIAIAAIGWYLSSNLAHDDSENNKQDANLIQQISVILNQVKPILEKIAKKNKNDADRQCSQQRDQRQRHATI